VLRHAAASRSGDDPVGSFARTVLSGEATLQGAAANPWHSQGLAGALEKAQRERDQMTPQQRAVYDEAAQRLRAADNDEGGDGAAADGDVTGEEQR
jgi:hypothetical protein